MDNAVKHDRALHLMGLLSDGLVHSSQEHAYALLRMARENEVRRVFVHCFLDGRDTPPSSAEKYVAAMQEKCQRDWRRRDCHGGRPLLCDGSRQALGAN